MSSDLGVAILVWTKRDNVPCCQLVRSTKSTPDGSEGLSASLSSVYVLCVEHVQWNLSTVDAYRTQPVVISCIERCPQFRGRFVHSSVVGLQTVPSLERCPLIQR